jgi:hypothetical protein
MLGRLATPPETQGEFLPAIPKPADLASDRLVRYFRDPFNPPEIHNELGALSACKSVSAITALALPPFACCCFPPVRFSPLPANCFWMGKSSQIIGLRLHTPGTVSDMWVYTLLRRDPGKTLSLMPSKARFEPAQVQSLKEV